MSFHAVWWINTDIPGQCQHFSTTGHSMASKNTRSMQWKSQVSNKRKTFQLQQSIVCV